MSPLVILGCGILIGAVGATVILLAGRAKGSARVEGRDFATGLAECRTCLNRFVGLYREGDEELVYCRHCEMRSAEIVDEDFGR